MARPTEDLDWRAADTPPTTSNIEPTIAKKANGWLSGEKPPYQTMNWLFWIIDKWIKFFDTMLSAEHKDDGKHKNHQFGTGTPQGIDETNTAVIIRASNCSWNGSVWTAVDATKPAVAEIFNWTDKKVYLRIKVDTSSPWADTVGVGSDWDYRQIMIDENGMMRQRHIGFHAYKNDSNQTIASGATTKITFNAEKWDIGGWFTTGADPALGSSDGRFTPQIEGYYDLFAGIAWVNCVADKTFILRIFKNSSEYVTRKVAVPTTDGVGLGIFTSVYANGTTDFFSVHVTNSFLVDKDISAVADQTFFYGHFTGDKGFPTP